MMDWPSMQIARFPDELPPRWHKPVLALGNFDGLHRGHMKIIDRVRQRAGERGGTPAAMTFDPHPPRILRPDKAPPLLMTGEQRIEALRRSGMQGVAVVRFTRELSEWDPETFVRNVLVDWQGRPLRVRRRSGETAKHAVEAGQPTVSACVSAFLHGQDYIVGCTSGECSSRNRPRVALYCAPFAAHEPSARRSRCTW